MDAIQFSIVIPVYNTDKKYISDAVSSCLEQTYGSFEIVIVDDGSQKECAEFLDSLQETDSRIKVIHKTNEGVSVARNTGVDNATGNYVIFVDSDDFLEYNALERLSEVLTEVPDVVVFSLTRDYSESIIPITPMYQNEAVFKEKEENYRLQADVLNAPLNTNILVFPYCKCIKRSILNNLQPCFPAGIAMCEDVIFSLRLFGATNHVVYITDTLYHYRQLWNSAVNKYRATAVEEQDVLLTNIKHIVSRSDNELLRKGYYMEAFYAMQRIIMMKYFHPKAPGNIFKRRKECGRVLSKKPYNVVFKRISLNSLPRNQKIKGYLIKYHLYMCMGLLRYVYFKMPGQKQI